MRAATPLRGRATELAALGDLVGGAAAGTMRIAIVDGEPGIGKSSLLAAGLSMAADRGFACARGSSTRIDSREPFAAIAGALQSWPDRGWRAEGAEAISPGPIEDDGRGRQYRIIDRAVSLLEQLSLRQPIALALDDLHWADTGTLRTIQVAVHRLAAYPVLALLGLRSHPRAGDLDGLVDELVRLGAVHLRLGPLPGRAVAELARDALGAEPSHAVRTRLRGAAGNPLFVTELLAALPGEADAIREDGDPTLGETVPPSLRLVILRRLSTLPRAAIDLLRLAAVLGTTFPMRELEALSGRRATELLAPMDQLLASSIISEDEAGLRFRHEVIRDAVYQDLPAALRRSLHREAGRALASAGMPAHRVAYHLALAAEAGDEEAITWLRRGAAAAARRDPAAAIGLLQRAIEILPDGADAGASLREELALSLAYSGDMRAAEEVIRATLEMTTTTDPPERLMTTLVQSLFAQGRWADIVTAASEFLAVRSTSPQTRARLLAERALAHVWTGDAAAADADAREAIRIGREVGDQVSICFGLGHLSVLADRRGSFEEGLRLANEGLEVGRSIPEAERRHPHIALGMAQVAADLLADAVETLRQGQRLGEQVGTVWDLPLYHTMLGLPMYYLGAWDDASAECQAGLELADEIGSAAGRVTAHSILALVAVSRGDADGAAEHVTLADEVVSAEGPQWGQGWLTLADARLREAHGDVGGALGLLHDRWRIGLKASAVEGALRHGPDIVRLSLAAGRRSLAERVAAQLTRIADRAPVTYGSAGALVARALLNGDGAMALRAARELESVGRVPEQARALADAAALTAAVDRQAARAIFDRALALQESLGARFEVTRTEAAMRSNGLRRGVRGTRRRPGVGWQSLTPTELQVVELAAAGLTNGQIGQRLFISPRTVQTHLAHVFNKLGISSRVELAAIHGQRSGSPSP